MFRNTILRRQPELIFELIRSLCKLHLGFGLPILRRSSFTSQSLFIVFIITLLFVTLKFIPQYDKDPGSKRISTVGQVFSQNNSRYVVQKRIPQAIIIGARKCGTRALLKFLDINDNIRAAPKEVHFFDSNERYRRGLDWYKDQMVESADYDITIEKSPSYFVTERVADRVAAMNISIKLILILRDPVIRLISDFSQIVANKIELSTNNDTTVEDIEHAWQEAAQVFERHLFRRDGSLKHVWRAVQMGMYSKYLEKWLRIFKLEQIHIVDGEKLIKDPYEELHKVEVFLNLRPTIKRQDFVFDKEKGFFCIAINNHQANETNITMLNNSPMGAFKANCLSKHKGRRHISVSNDIIYKLKQFYQPYNEYLFSLIGKQLSWSNHYNHVDLNE